MMAKMTWQRSKLAKRNDDWRNIQCGGHQHRRDNGNWQPGVGCGSRLFDTIRGRIQRDVTILTDNDWRT